MPRFQEIDADAFAETMTAIGFYGVLIPGVFEMVFARPFSESRFSVRVYSTISLHTGMSREKGSDAIRVMIHDHQLEVDVHIATVKRTANALTNVTQRCRDAWAWKNRHKCSCGAIMTKVSGRNGDFLGCSAFPKTGCKATRPL